MKKILKSFSTLIVAAMFMYVTCPPGSAVKYTDGRFIKNTQVIECMKQIVIQHEDYQNLYNEYSICSERIYFSFSVKKGTGKVRDVGIVVPVFYNSSVTSFSISLVPNHDLSSFDLANLFLNSDEFNKEDFYFDDEISIVSSPWNPNIENEYDNEYSIMTDITEDNWREKFSDEESVIPDLCPGSLMFFELHPNEKVFVEGYDY